MNEIRVGIVTYTAAVKSQSRFAQLERIDTWHAQVNSFRLNVQAVPGNAGGVSA
jgi:hypothetical protein